jgi:2-dehydropantoate 2-reductase
MSQRWKLFELTEKILVFVNFKHFYSFSFAKILRKRSKVKILKIAIIGAGAMGSLFGGLLARVADVCLYDINAVHIAAIQQKGLIMAKGEETEIVHLRATTDPKAIGLMDAVIVFVKFPFTRQAMIDGLVSAIGPDTIVLTVQNGIGNVDIIREFVSDEQVMYGLSTLTSDLAGPGRIKMTTLDDVPTCIWPLANNITEKMSELGDLMFKAGLNTTITKDVDRQIWQKLTVNASQNTLCALLRQNVSGIMHTPASYEIAKQIIFEVAEIAQAKGINLSRQEALDHVMLVVRAVPQHVPSMAIDVKDGRQTEIACLNEAIVAEGKRLGIAAPMTEAVARMIRALQSNYDHLVY